MRWDDVQGAGLVEGMLGGQQQQQQVGDEGEQQTEEDQNIQGKDVDKKLPSSQEIKKGAQQAVDKVTLGTCDGSKCWDCSHIVVGDNDNDNRANKLLVKSPAMLKRSFLRPSNFAKAKKNKKKRIFHLTSNNSQLE
jgi:hypothetical protein